MTYFPDMSCIHNYFANCSLQQSLDTAKENLHKGIIDLKFGAVKVLDGIEETFTNVSLMGKATQSFTSGCQFLGEIHQKEILPLANKNISAFTLIADVSTAATSLSYFYNGDFAKDVEKGKYPAVAASAFFFAASLSYAWDWAIQDGIVPIASIASNTATLPGYELVKEVVTNMPLTASLFVCAFTCLVAKHMISTIKGKYDWKHFTHLASSISGLASVALQFFPNVPVIYPHGAMLVSQSTGYAAHFIQKKPENPAPQEEVEGDIIRFDYPDEADDARQRLANIMVDSLEGRENTNADTDTSRPLVEY